MSGTAGVPNAWDDDDWVSQADKGAPSVPQPALSKQERLQQHAEANRKLWESADSPDTFHYIEAGSGTGGAPLPAASFKPQVKVLSRKPVLAKRPPAADGDAAYDNDNDDDDDDGRRGGAQLLSPEEIRAKQKRERDEKQRRYDEARAKIFGESGPSSRGSSPGAGTVTPPPRSHDARGANTPARGRGRGGGGGSGSAYRGHNGGSGSNTSNAGGHYFDNRRPANASGAPRELYDPNSSPKLEASRARGGSSGDSSRALTPRVDQQQQQQYPQQHQAIRSPRGPDSSGRGGFGLARRGARET